MVADVGGLVGRAVQQNAQLKRSRAQRTQPQVDQRFLTALGDLGAEPLPEEVIERRETGDLVRMALAQLPGHYRQALTQHYCDQTPLKEMARREQSTVGAIKSLLHRARQAFQSAVHAIVEVAGEGHPAREAIR